MPETEDIHVTAEDMKPVIQEALVEMLQGIDERLQALEEARGDVQTQAGALEAVELVVEPPRPTLGRIVHYRLLNGPEPNDRPAIITEVFEDDTVALWLFARLNDVPFAHVTAVRMSDQFGAYVDRAREGEEAGEWHWPEIYSAEAEEEEEVVPDE